MPELKKNIAETIKGIVESKKIKPQTLDTQIGHAPFAFVPNDHSVAPLANFLPCPLRIKAAPSFNDATSFAKYFDLFHVGSTLVFADLDKKKIKAIFDYHAPGAAGKPAWCEHSAYFGCQLSDEWKIWNSTDKKKMDQADFANFIENNLPDIVKPKAATMLEMIVEVATNTNVTFKSKYSLASGLIKMEYSEDRTNSGNKEMELPETFSMVFPVFINTAPVALEAKIRNRIRDGKLVLWYELKQPHKILDLAFRDIVEKVQVETNTDIFFGEF